MGNKLTSKLIQLAGWVNSTHRLSILLGSTSFPESIAQGIYLVAWQCYDDIGRNYLLLFPFSASGPKDRHITGFFSSVQAIHV